jgi:hypothetical protein
MNWTKESSAANALYEILLQFQQLDQSVSFDEAGQLTMRQLAYFDIAANADIIAAQALALARNIELILENTHGAVYKTDYQKGSAITALATVMRDPNRRISQLAETIGGYFSFDGTNNTGPKYY